MSLINIGSYTMVNNHAKKKPAGSVRVVHSGNHPLLNVITHAAEYGWMFVEQSFINEEGKETKRRAKYFGLYQYLKILKEGDILPGKIIILESLTPFNQDNPDCNLKVEGNTGVICTIDDNLIYRITYYDASNQMEDKCLVHDNEEEIRDIRKAVEALQRNKRLNVFTKDNPNNYLLFFDTETTGLPQNWKAPLSDFKNWPRLVQLAYLMYDFDGNLIAEGNHIIKPKGFRIPYDAEKVHGISTEKALQQGEELEFIIDLFYKRIENAAMLVAHNMSFDEKIIGCEILRTGRKNIIQDKKKICTMEKSTEYCSIPGPYGYKWPKLSELHYKLFSKPCVDTHNAAVDIKYTADCFWELKRRAVITI